MLNDKDYKSGASALKQAVFGGMLLMSGCSLANATVVEFRTSLGNVQVNLFDSTTPETVENFLNYVNSATYVNNVIHRVEPNFVVQGGGFSYAGEFETVAAGSPVINEPKLSNVRGTIAMAKLGGQPNSATTQWFFNLANNSANLDVQNGGFTVFGQVLGDGMDVIDAIAALTRFNLGGAANSIPLRDYTAADATNNKPITAANVVLISDIVVVDDSVDTHPEIVPVANTLINQAGSDNGSSGGGAMGWLALSGLLLVRLFSRRK